MFAFSGPSVGFQRTIGREDRLQTPILVLGTCCPLGEGSCCTLVYPRRSHAHACLACTVCTMHRCAVLPAASRGVLGLLEALVLLSYRRRQPACCSCSCSNSKCCKSSFICASCSLCPPKQYDLASLSPNPLYNLDDISSLKLKAVRPPPPVPVLLRGSLRHGHGYIKTIPYNIYVIKKDEIDRQTYV